MPAQNAADDRDLNARLNTFYAAEESAENDVPGAASPPDAQPFDLLVINICPLSGRMSKRQA